MSRRIKVTALNSESNERMCKFFKIYKDHGFSKFGDAECILPSHYEEHAEALMSMRVRPDDAWIATFPRSGTTWTQELVWLLKNDCDFESAFKTHLEKRYYFIELYATLPAAIRKFSLDGPDYKNAENAPSPRFFKTHLPLSLLPTDVLDTAKLIYVARDPRDVAVSYFHHNKRFKVIDDSSEFKEYWNFYINNQVEWSPYFVHVKEAWSKRNHPNMLFIFYEEMIQDMPSVIRRIAAFLGKEVTEDQIEKLSEHLNIKNFKNNESVHPPWMRNPAIVNAKAEPFIRNGKTGEWQKYFDAEMTAQADNWLRKNLADTDLKFPSVSLEN